MTELPRRSFTPLPPPAGGADEAIAGGRRRRQRRRAAGVALTAAAAVAVGIAISPGGTPSGAARVVTTTTTPTGTPAPPAGERVRTTPPATAPSSAAPVTARPATEPTGSPEATAPSQAPATRPPYRSGPLRRSYTAADPTGARVCNANLSGSGGQEHARIDWCVQASAVATTTGHDLEVSVCRDQTTGATLHLPHGVPVDLTVSSTDGVVWRWSRDQLAQPAEALATPAGACWTWTTSWSDVDASGRPLPGGRYTLVGTSKAQELADLPDSQPVTFTI